MTIKLFLHENVWVSLGGGRAELTLTGALLLMDHVNDNVHIRHDHCFVWTTLNTRHV